MRGAWLMHAGLAYPVALPSDSSPIQHMPARGPRAT